MADKKTQPPVSPNRFQWTGDDVIFDPPAPPSKTE